MYLADRIQVFLERHKKYGFIFYLDLTLLSIVKTQDNETTVYESTDVTSLYLVGPLETATEYTASVQLVTKDFGKSDYTNPITIKTLPSKLSGKNSQNQYN